MARQELALVGLVVGQIDHLDVELLRQTVREDGHNRIGMAEYYW